MKKITMVFDIRKSIFESCLRLQKQGDADAQSNLGFCYANGIGAAQDMREAVKWFKKAAEQGDENAKAQLKKLGY